MKIADKTVLITGAGSGIGAALARRCASMGARVCVSDRDGEKAAQVAGEIGGLAMVCDVTSEAQVRELVEAAEAGLGPVDLFVSNAGLGHGDPSHAASASNEVWELNWQVHVMAHVFAARALLPGMLARGSGYFVNVASAAGLLNQIGDAAYSATKHAAVSFAESLAITHGQEGIGVSVVCPQYVATPLIGLDASAADGANSLLTAEDVAEAVVKGVEARDFLILPHPAVAKYAALRGQDHGRWITGMQMLRAKAMTELGGLNLKEFYKLV